MSANVTTVVNKSSYLMNEVCWLTKKNGHGHRVGGQLCVHDLKSSMFTIVNLSILPARRVIPVVEFL